MFSEEIIYRHLLQRVLHVNSNTHKSFLITVCEVLMRKLFIVHGVKIMLSEFYMDKKGRRPYITFDKSEIIFL